MSSVKKIIIFSLMSALVFILVVIFLIIPLFGSIKETSGRILTEKKDLAFFENQALKAEQFEDNYKNLEITPEKINVFLVNPSAPIELIKFFENLAKETGLTIKISPVSSPKLKNDSWNSMGFSIELTGNFSGIIRFLEKTETSHYLIEVQKFRARRIVEKDVPTEKISAILEVKVFAKDQ